MAVSSDYLLCFFPSLVFVGVTSALGSEFHRQGRLFPGNPLCRGNSAASLPPQSGSVQPRKGCQLGAQAQSLSFLPPVAEALCLQAPEAKFCQEHSLNTTSVKRTSTTLWCISCHTHSGTILFNISSWASFSSLLNYGMKERKRKKGKGKKRDTISPEFPSPPLRNQSSLFSPTHSTHV